MSHRIDDVLILAKLNRTDLHLSTIDMLRKYYIIVTTQA